MLLITDAAASPATQRPQKRRARSTFLDAASGGRRPKLPPYPQQAKSDSKSKIRFTSAAQSLSRLAGATGARLPRGRDAGATGARLARTTGVCVAGA